MASEYNTNDESPENAPPQVTNAEALAQAKEHMKHDQILAAARLMKKAVSSDPSNNGTNLTEEDVAFLKEVETKSALIDHIITDLLSNPEAPKEDATGDDNNVDFQPTEETWIKQGESHGDRDTIMYYQVTEDLQLKCRMETPIESSLLVPLLSVLVETDLYTSWLPRWNVPNIGLDSVTKLAQMGRTEQLVQFISAVPWPFAARDVMLQTVACDDIHDIPGNTTGSIVIGIHSLEEGDVIRKSTVCQEHYKDEKDFVEVQPPPEGLKRAEVDGGLLFRKCPDDHICLHDSTVEYPPGEHLILVGFSMRIDGKISPLFPQRIINFVIQVRSWLEMDIASRFYHSLLTTMFYDCLNRASFYAFFFSPISRRL